MDRDFKGIWIDRAIWLDERLSALEKVILAEIDSLDIDNRGCFASNQYLADFCQCSVTKVSTSISKLIDLGYLELGNFDGRMRVLKSRLSKSERQTTKNCKHNNTTNNTEVDKKVRKKDSYARLINEFTDDEDLKQALFDFIAMRQMIKKPMSDNALKQLLKKLSNLSQDEAEQVKILEQSIFNSWQGVYPLKEEEQRELPARPQKPKTVGTHFEYERQNEDDDDIYFDPAGGF